MSHFLFPALNCWSITLHNETKKFWKVLSNYLRQALYNETKKFFKK